MEYRASVAALVLANKLLEDHTYTAKTWASLSQLPSARTVTQVEMAFWRGLGYSILVQPTELEEFKMRTPSLLAFRSQEVQRMMDLAARRQSKTSPSKPSPKNISPIPSTTSTALLPTPPLSPHQTNTTKVGSPSTQVPTGSFTFTPPSEATRLSQSTLPQELLATLQAIVQTHAQGQPLTPAQAQVYAQLAAFVQAMIQVQAQSQTHAQAQIQAIQAHAQAAAQVQAQIQAQAQAQIQAFLQANAPNAVQAAHAAAQVHAAQVQALLAHNQQLAVGYGHPGWP